MRYLLFFLLTASAFGQSRQVFLRLLAFDRGIPTESFLFDPAAPTPVPGLPAEIKGYLNHQGVTAQITGSDVVFSKSGKAEDGKKSELQLSKVTLPKTGNRFILIFLPPAGAGQPIRIMPLEDTLREFPLGSYRVVNLSRNPVKMALEDKPYELKPGSSTLIEDPPVKANGQSDMLAFSFVGGKWERIGAGIWPHPGRKRSVQMFWDNPINKRTELNEFRDISPPTPNAPAAGGAAAATTE